MPFHRPSGNCTFEDESSSVGYCSRCTDISERIIVDKISESVVFDAYKAIIPDFTLRLPAAQVSLEARQFEPPGAPELTQILQVPTDVLSFNASIVGTESVRFAMNYFDGTVNMLWFDDVSWADADRNKNGGNNPRAHAMEFSLNPCIHTFRGAVANGVLAEETIQRGPMFSGNTGGIDLYATMATVDLRCVNESVQENLSDVGYVFTTDTRWLPYNVTANPHLRDSDVERHSTFDRDVTGMNTTERGLAKGFYSENSSTKTLTDAALRIVPSDCIYQIHVFVPTSLDSLYFDACFNESLRDTGAQGVQGPVVPTAFYNAGAIDHNQDGTLETVQRMTQNIADSMTTYLR